MADYYPPDWMPADPTVAGAADAAHLATRTVLEEAADITSGDRQTHYGHPSDNHGATADLWSTYLTRKYGAPFALSARDVCMFLILQKVSRDANMPKRDNLTDICGYARNAEMCDE